MKLRRPRFNSLGAIDHSKPGFARPNAKCSSGVPFHECFVKDGPFACLRSLKRGPTARPTFPKVEATAIYRWQEGARVSCLIARGPETGKQACQPRERS